MKCSGFLYLSHLPDSGCSSSTASSSRTIASRAFGVLGEEEGGTAQRSNLLSGDSFAAYHGHVIPNMEARTGLKAGWMPHCELQRSGFTGVEQEVQSGALQIAAQRDSAFVDASDEPAHGGAASSLKPACS